MTPSRTFNNAIVACHRSPDLERLVLNTADKDFNSINVSTAIHRLGKLRKAEDYTSFRNPECVKKLFSIAKSTAAMNPQTLCNIMLGIANGRLTGSGKFPEFIHDELVRHQHFLRDFSPQALSAVFFSFAVLGQSFPPSLAHFYVGELEKRDFRSFHNLDFPQLLWSLGTLRLHCPAVYNKFLRELTRNPTNTKTSLSATAPPPPPFRKLEEFSVLSLSNMLWSFAEMGHPCRSLALSMTRCLVPRPGGQATSATPVTIREADHKFIIRFMWSLAALDLLRDADVVAFFQTTPPVYVERTPLASKYYLQTRLAWEQAHGGSGVRSALLDKLDSAMANGQVDAADQLVQSRSKLLSPEALRVLDYLGSSSTGLGVQRHFQLAKGVYCDACVPDKKLVIELETPFHFAANSDGSSAEGGGGGGDKVLLGSALFFRRLVSRAGYKLAVINLKSFARDYSAEQQDEMLTNLANQIRAM